MQLFNKQVIEYCRKERAKELAAHNAPYDSYDNCEAIELMARDAWKTVIKKATGLDEPIVVANEKEMHIYVSMNAALEKTKLNKNFVIW